MNKILNYLSVGMFPSKPEEGIIGSLEYNLWLAQLAGYPFSKSWKPVLQKIYFGALFTTGVIYTFFELLDLTESVSNINDFTNNACVTINHICVHMKTVNLMYHFQEVNNIMQELRKMVKMYVCSESQKKAFIRLELENKVPLAVYVSIIFVTIFLIISMLIADFEVERTTFPFMVKLPSVIPFPFRAVYIIIALFLLAIQIATADYLNISLINQLRFQLRILEISLEDLSEVDFEKRYNQLPEHRLISCVIHHNQIINLNKRVLGVFSIPSLIQMLTSLLTFALTGYQAIKFKSDFVDGFTLYCFVVAIFVQLFAYCWFGNELMEQVCFQLFMQF